MIKVLMCDVGETLVHDDHPMPFALDCLRALRRFETAAGTPLERCLVSDFGMPASPTTAKELDAITREYVALVDGFGVGPFFRPVRRRVTLSAHAGAAKPDRAVFTTALDRLGVTARLSQCLFVTENANHVQACRDMGMKAIEYGRDTNDWPETLLVVRRMVAPTSTVDTRHALAVYFAATFGAKLVALDGPPTAGRVRARVRLPATGGSTKHVRVRFETDGRVASVEWPEEVAQQADEAAAFVSSLRAHGQLAAAGEPLPPGATHEIDVASGRISRRRVSAV
jgi:hypothetical protein